MFGTFRYSKTTKDYEHVELSNDDNVDARGYTLLACDSCRARKVVLVLLQLRSVETVRLGHSYTYVAYSSNATETGTAATDVWPAHQELALISAGRDPGSYQCLLLQRAHHQTRNENDV
jgi:hypothetical protein